MPQGKLTALEPGFVTRVAQGFRYAATGMTPDGFFGPSGAPAPMAPEAAGRQFDYPTGFNLRTTTRHNDGLGFNDLRGLADSYDLLRLVIETRKDQIARLDWTIGPRAGTGIAATDPRSLALQRFFRKPDLEHDWATWLRLLLEDLLVLDAPCLYRRKSVTGAPFAFEIMDGALIKRVIDDRGRTPLPPDPAYQQILKGLPAVDYTTAELLYLPRNPRPNRVYGYGPVEQIVMSVNIALRRQASQLAYFTEGNTPEALVGVPPEWTPDQIGQFQQYWDSLLAGDLGQRRHTRFVPGGLEYHPTREVTLKDQFDEWLARVVCFAFSVSPSAFISQVNRATAQTAQQTAEAEGLQPLKLWVKSLVDRLIEEDFGWGDLEFGWCEESAPDPATLMTINTGYVAAGIKTVDEARADIGLGSIAGGNKPTPQPQLVHRGYDPSEPRDENGRWTTGTGSTDATTTSRTSSTDSYADATQSNDNSQSDIVPADWNGEFHDIVVNEVASTFEQAGFRVFKSVQFEPVWNKITSWPIDEKSAIADMVVQFQDNNTMEIVEVKTGIRPSYTRAQRALYPLAQIGYYVRSSDPRISQMGYSLGAPLPPMNVLVMYQKDPNSEKLMQLLPAVTIENGERK